MFAGLTLLLGTCRDSVGSPGTRAWVVFVRESSMDTIFVADPEAGAIDRKIALPMRASRFRFSPAGDRLAIVSGSDLRYNGNFSRIARGLQFEFVGPWPTPSS